MRMEIYNLSLKAGCFRSLFVYLFVIVCNVYASPESPSYIGSWSFDCSACIKFESNNQTFLAAGVGTYFVVYSIDSKGQLKEKTRLFFKSKIIALCNDGKYFYLYTENKKLAIVLLENSTLYECSSVPVGENLNFWGASICKYNDKIIIGGTYFFMIFDVADPKQPKFLFTTKCEAYLNVSNMVLAGDSLYAATISPLHLVITDSAWPQINLPVVGLEQKTICRNGNTLYSHDDTTLTVRERGTLKHKDSTYTLRMPYRQLEVVGVYRNNIIAHKNPKKICILQKNPGDSLFCSDTLSVPGMTSSIVTWNRFIYRANRFNCFDVFDGSKKPWGKISTLDSLRYGGILDYEIIDGKLYTLQQDGLIHILKISDSGTLNKVATTGISDTSFISFTMAIMENRLYVLSSHKRGRGINLTEYKILPDGSAEYVTSVLLCQYYLLPIDFKKYCFAKNKVVFIDDSHLTVYDLISRRQYTFSENKFMSTTVRIRTKENIAYVYNSYRAYDSHEDTLYSFDIADSGKIKLVNRLPLLSLGDIFLGDNRLYGCGSRRDDVVVDITDPDSVVEIDSEPDTSFVGFGATQYTTEGIKLNNVLFTTCAGERCIRIYDVSKPDTPVYRNSLVADGSYSKLRTDEKYLYAIKDNVSIDVFDLYK